MPVRPDPRYGSVTTPSDEIARVYRETIDDDDSPVSIAVVHYRGGQPEFDLGKNYALSPDPWDRVVGAVILGQLGWGENSFHDESVDILIDLLRDTDPNVVASAASGLRHRRSRRANPFVLPLIHHPDPKVRLAATAGISGQEDPDAIAGLIVLARDEDRDVRNWAAFDLGTIIDTDTPEIREALAPLLEEEDDEIRGEALIGLAKRHDPRALPALIRELQGPFWGSWCLEAAEFLHDPVLIPLLISMRAALPPEDEATFGGEFARAVAVCGGEPVPSPETTIP